MGSAQCIEIIPIGAIDIVNPRVRNRRIFKEIVTSVAELGLKRPITVKRKACEGDARYDLVCGQGRLEAYQALGQREIPAVVVDATNEDRAIMSWSKTAPGGSIAPSIFCMIFSGCAGAAMSSTTSRGRPGSA